MSDSQLSRLVCRTMSVMKLQRFGRVINRSRIIHTSRFGDKPLWFRPFTTIKVAGKSSGYGLVEDETLARKKIELFQALEGTNYQPSSIILVILCCCELHLALFDWNNKICLKESTEGYLESHLARSWKLKVW